MEKYKIGESVMYGNLVCKPSQLTEVTESYFEKALTKSLKENELFIHRNISLKKSDLRKGVTIGNDSIL
jgi:hypothetical protein